VCFFSFFCLFYIRHIQKDVSSEAQGTAEGIREAGKETERYEVIGQVNETSRKSETETC